MGRNRKWVLENDLSEAVWRTILRGPRPPSVVWPRGSERPSSVSKSPGGLNQGRPPHHQSTKSRASKGLAKLCAPTSVRLSPDERVAEARTRVARLEAALQVLGETSPEAQPIQESLRKAREQCRVQPVGERLDSTLKFIQRSRVRIEKIQVDPTREQSLLQQALESLERLRDEAASSVPEPTQEQMDVEDPAEEVRRLRAQIAELQHDRAAKREVRST